MRLWIANEASTASAGKSGASFSGMSDSSCFFRILSLYVSGPGRAGDKARAPVWSAYGMAQRHAQLQSGDRRCVCGPLMPFVGARSVDGRDFALEQAEI